MPEGLCSSMHGEEQPKGPSPNAVGRGSCRDDGNQSKGQGLPDAGSPKPRWPLEKKTINKKKLVEAGRANPHRLGPSKAWRSCRSCAVSVGVAQWFGGTGLWLGGTGGRGLVMLAGV